MPLSPFHFATRTVRNLNRYRQILTVLAKYGFADFVDRLRIGDYFEFARQLLLPRGEPATRQTRAQRLRLALEELGPTFVKLGQMLSTRPDLVPADVAQEFALLREHVAPFPADQAREIIAQALNQPVDALFASFVDEPLAAASIAQVHRARLHSGEEVVVKVRRPGIEEVLEADLEILQHMAALVEHRFPDWAVQRPTRVAAEFGRSLDHELDLTLEAGNIERFRRDFDTDPTVRVPRVFPALTARNVLTLEYLDVTPMTSPEALREAGFDPERLARRGAELTLKQIFVHGFFHADPHPGNLFALPGDVVCLLDFGAVGRLSPSLRATFSALIQALGERDPEQATRALLRMTERDRAIVDPDRLAADVAVFLDHHLVDALGQLDFSRLLNDMIKLVNQHGVRIPTELVTMLKAAATVESLARTLDPSLDLLSMARPYVRRARLGALSPRRALRMISDAIGESIDLAREIPGSIRKLMYHAQRQGLNIGFEHHGLQPMINTTERIANRLAFAVVVAALIVGSSVIVHSNLPPTWNGVPVIGMAGYVVAGIMGLILLVAILRHGGL
jgi:ubiquinone biosynthesis protein